MGETQCRIPGDRPLTVQNPGDTVGGHVKLACQPGGAHAEFLKLFGQVLAWVDRDQCHGIFLFLVVIDDFYAHGSWRPVRPLEANPPLIVYADAVLAFAVAGQCFKTVAGQDGKSLVRLSR